MEWGGGRARTHTAMRWKNALARSKGKRKACIYLHGKVCARNDEKDQQKMSESAA